MGLVFLHTLLLPTLLRSNKHDTLSPSLPQAPPSEKGWKTVDFFVGENLRILGTTTTPTTKYHSKLATTPTTKYHSQCGQDWLVASLLNCQEHGYFLDLAANDAVELSNTLALENQLNWSGVCVEPNLSYYSASTTSPYVVKNGRVERDVPITDPDGTSLLRRKCQLVRAAVGSPRNSRVKFNFGGKHRWQAMGGITGFDVGIVPLSDDQVRPMRTVNLNELLRHIQAPTVIDYMSLDVEGSESIVMESFDWSTYKFRVITVERPKVDLVEMLALHGYKKLRSNAVFDDETWLEEGLYTKVSEMWGKDNWSDLPRTSCMGDKPVPHGGVAACSRL